MTAASKPAGKKDARAVMGVVTRLARRGNLTAARLVLEREKPPRNGCLVRFNIPRIKTAEDVVRALSSVIESAGKGRLTLEEAGIIAGLIEAQRKAIETAENEKRIQALEALRVEHDER